jgi:chromosomal replication initiation ATPase DnaA
MAAEQLLLNLPVRTAMNAADFVVSASNRDAVAWLDRWPDWPGGAIAIYGPPGCGKTHLAHVWQARSAAHFLDGGIGQSLPSEPRVILDSGRLPEEELFHLINHMRAERGSLLILDRDPPARWAVRLPDLASRLASIPAIAVEPPDDALLAAIIAKHFADRQIKVRPELIDYLTRHIERSFAAAESMVAELDRAAMQAGTPVSIKLARGIVNRETT